MVDGKTIKELETRAKTALYANEYTNGNLLISAEVLLNLIHEVKVKDIIIVLNQEEENVHSYQRIRNICISLFKSAL